jgi:hypothetical protein
MGWNDARAVLVARGWEVVTEESLIPAQTIDGTPLRIYRLERKLDMLSNKLNPRGIRCWLERTGFQTTVESKFGDRLSRHDVEVFIGVQDDEVSEVTLTFQLSKESVSHWPEWTAITTALCDQWNLSVYDPECGFMVEGQDVLHVLSKTLAWQEFATQFRWPSVS